jgi:hypothetical protein
MECLTVQKIISLLKERIKHDKDLGIEASDRIEETAYNYYRRRDHQNGRRSCLGRNKGGGLDGRDQG